MRESKMANMKRKAKEVATQSRETAVRVGKAAKSAAVAGAKAGASAALMAGALEAERTWKATEPRRIMTGWEKAAAIAAGAVALGAVGIAIAQSQCGRRDWRTNGERANGRPLAAVFFHTTSPNSDAG